MSGYVELIFCCQVLATSTDHTVLIQANFTLLYVLGGADSSRKVKAPYRFVSKENMSKFFNHSVCNMLQQIADPTDTNLGGISNLYAVVHDMHHFAQTRSAEFVLHFNTCLANRELYLAVICRIRNLSSVVEVHISSKTIDIEILFAILSECDKEEIGIIVTTNTVTLLCQLLQRCFTMDGTLTPYQLIFIDWVSSCLDQIAGLVTIETTELLQEFLCFSNVHAIVEVFRNHHRYGNHTFSISKYLVTTISNILPHTANATPIIGVLLCCCTDFIVQNSLHYVKNRSIVSRSLVKAISSLFGYILQNVEHYKDVINCFKSTNSTRQDWNRNNFLDRMKLDPRFATFVVNLRLLMI